MVSTRPLNSKSSIPCTNNLPSSLIATGITVTFIFHSFFFFFSSVVRSRYLSLFSLFFSFFFFFFLDNDMIWSSVREKKWPVSISISQRILCISFSWTDSGLCVYHLFVRSNLNPQQITLPTQSYLVLYCLCANWQHSYYYYNTSNLSTCHFSINSLEKSAVCIPYVSVQKFFLSLKKTHGLNLCFAKYTKIDFLTL